MDSSSPYVMPHGRAPSGRHLGGGQGFVPEWMVEQEQCPAAARIHCGVFFVKTANFVARSLGSTGPQW